MKKYLVRYLMHDLDRPEIEGRIFGNPIDNKVERSEVREGRSESEVIEKLMKDIIDDFYGVDVILDIKEIN